MRVLADFGFRRSTVELTAKYAGLSHMTIYRRWPKKSDLFRAAVLREFTTVFDDEFGAATAEESFDEVVAAAFSGIVWTVHQHPVMARELSTEPEFVLPLLTTNSGPVMDAVAGLVTERLARSAAAMDRTLDDPQALADIFVRLALSLLLMPDPSRPMAARDDVEGYARRFLVPLTRTATVTPRP
jgi:AcrR family transcriptional regulator